MARVIDLSRPIYNDMEVYPGDPAVKVRVVHSLAREGWVLRELVMGSHTGTHVDAFSHMHQEGKTLDEIPLSCFFGKARVVTPGQDLPRGVGLIFAAGRADTGLLDRISAAGPPFVGVGRRGYEFFTVELERQLLARAIVTYSGLVNVDKLPRDAEFMFYGFPLKIQEGDGSPVRAVAVVG